MWMSSSSAHIWHCIQTCTVVRTDDRLSASFEVKVGLHQGSVLNPLLCLLPSWMLSPVRR